MRTKRSQDNFVVDPVCGMKKEKNKMGARSVYKRRVYYFCYEGDKKIFELYPEYWSANLRDSKKKQGGGESGEERKY